MEYLFLLLFFLFYYFYFLRISNILFKTQLKNVHCLANMSLPDKKGIKFLCLVGSVPLYIVYIIQTAICHISYFYFYYPF